MCSLFQDDHLPLWSVFTGRPVFHETLNYCADAFLRDNPVLLATIWEDWIRYKVFENGVPAGARRKVGERPLEFEPGL